MPSLAQLYNKQTKKPQAPQQPKQQSSKRMDIVFHMPEVKSLINHLNILYSSMIVSQMNTPSNNSMWEKVSWYSPGQGAVKQSQSVN